MYFTIFIAPTDVLNLWIVHQHKENYWGRIHILQYIISISNASTLAFLFHMHNKYNSINLDVSQLCQDA